MLAVYKYGKFQLLNALYLMTTYPCYYFSGLKTEKNIALKKIYDDIKTFPQKILILDYKNFFFVSLKKLQF